MKRLRKTLSLVLATVLTAVSYTHLLTIKEASPPLLSGGPVSPAAPPIVIRKESLQKFLSLFYSLILFEQTADATLQASAVRFAKLSLDRAAFL